MDDEALATERRDWNHTSLSSRARAALKHTNASLPMRRGYSGPADGSCWNLVSAALGAWPLFSVAGAKCRWNQTWPAFPE